MIKRSRIIFVVLILWLVGASSAAAQPAPWQGLDDYVNQSMRAWEVPGVAIAIVKDDKVVFAKGYGVRKLGEAAPVNERTVFAIGSSSKAFTAASIAMLVDEGKLKWDDPATKYLPGFQLYDPAVTRDLTVRDLLCHRSGLERGDGLWYGTDFSRDEILRRIRYLKPSWGFRSTFGYQNIMFLAAGQIIPAVTGKSWDEFVKERIFTPLGMTSSYTSTLPLRDLDNVASPHIRIDGQVQPVPWRNLDNVGPAGSINSNVVDMAQWVRLQLREGLYQDRRLIQAASVEEMHASQMTRRLEKWLSNPSPVNHALVPGTHFAAYGMGWFLQDYRGRKLVHHGGAIDGMRAMVAMIPEENFGFVILTSIGNRSLAEGLMFRILDLHLGAPLRDWSAEILAGTKTLEAQMQAAQKRIEDARVKGTSPSRPLEQYVGAYQSEMYGDAKVALENNHLVLRVLGGTFTLDHWHYDTFRASSSDRARGSNFVSFALDVQARVKELEVGGAGSFKRVPEPAKAAAGGSR